MDLFDAIAERRSVRSFQDREVEQEKLERILEAARLAPSASNRQEWRFVVVRRPELRQKLAEAARGQQFVAEAPVVIAACAVDHDHVMSCGHPSFLVDVSIALEHIALAARPRRLAGPEAAQGPGRDSQLRRLGRLSRARAEPGSPFSGSSTWPRGRTSSS